MGARQVEAFLTQLAVQRKVAAAARNQALVAPVFLCKGVLAGELPWLDRVTRANKPPRLPVVLTAMEGRCLLAQGKGVCHLTASLFLHL